MKLKSEITIHELGNKHIVTLGNCAVRCNDTAKLIILYLNEGYQVSDIIKRLEHRFDISEQQAQTDIESVINTLRALNAIEET